MKTDDLELPLGYKPITGPGVDAFERRKERGSPVDLEGSFKYPPPSFFIAMADLVRRMNEYVAAKAA